MTTISTSTDPARDRVQRRVLTVLFATQIIGGVGVAVGIAVGALLTADMVGVAASGLAQSAAVVGSALLAVPATQVVLRFGRRPSLGAAYLIAAAGSAAVVAAAVSGSTPLLFVGFFLFGGATTASLQARYAAVDLAPAAARGRHLALVVWGTTVGAVAGPNLAPAAGSVLQASGIPTLAAPFVFSTGLFALAAAVLLLFLRPDPGRLAMDPGFAASTPSPGGGTDRGSASAPGRSGIASAIAGVRASGPARLGIGAAAVGHLVMVGVMSMTPIHIRAAGHDAPTTLSLVGVVLSVHIAGMFALAPVTGWLTDRFGRQPVIAGGGVLLLVACAVAGTAGHDPLQLGVGLTLLGMGWSGTMVAGSTLLSESVTSDVRASVQGLSDLVMGLAGAMAGAVAGFVIQAGGYPVLAGLGALCAVPLIWLAGRASASPASIPTP